jgi:hypothetical protein
MYTPSTTKNLISIQFSTTFWTKDTKISTLPSKNKAKKRFYSARSLTWQIGRICACNTLIRASWITLYYYHKKLQTSLKSITTSKNLFQKFHKNHPSRWNETCVVTGLSVWVRPSEDICRRSWRRPFQKVGIVPNITRQFRTECSDINGKRRLSRSSRNKTKLIISNFKTYPWIQLQK